MNSNSFLGYSYKKRTVYSSMYVYDLSNGKETITTPPNIDSNNDTLASKVKDFKYYVDNGKTAYDSVTSSLYIGSLPGNSSSIVAALFDILTGTQTTSEKVIAALKEIVGTVPVPPAFLISDISIVLANRANCKNTFERIKTLI
ncbi:hypothetical protein [Geosporobacter ferrireducens]|uniref:hypothetical protein n=1 Tax=Geosporobacter ferrireducens TaxID=1424294 RepID=UPI00139C756A|nr:hypothetical protein [Geosporobacter ferrireducens]MTI58162.1 hypothetical protein [Geosporobacter ferrireducens]